MLPLLIVFPLLLAIATHEWPLPWTGVTTATRLAAVSSVPLGLALLGAAAGNWLPHVHRSWFPMLGWISGSLILSLLLGWSPWVAERLGPAGLLTAAVILVPHLLSLFTVWTLPPLVAATAAKYRGEVDAARRFAAIGNDLRLRSQWYLLPILLPLFVVLAARDLLEWLPAWDQAHWIAQVIWLSLTSMIVVLFSFPLVLRYGLPTSNIPNPDLQRPLAIYAARFGLQIHEIARWHTRGRIANAMVVGWLPGMRRILLSDRLCTHLSSRELFAVFLHEAGHLRRHHLWWRLLVVVFGSLLLLWVVSQFPTVWQSQPTLPDWSLGLAAVHAIGLCGLIACLLSYVSRMLEFEADDFVMEQVANATHPVSTDPGPLETRHSELPCDGQDLIQAIRKAGRLNGVDPDRITWMHPSIEQRIERIGWSQRSPVYRRLAGRRIKMLKLCLITATALLLGLLLLTNA